MKGFRHWNWHLDEMYVKIGGEMHYLCRAVDQEGEIVESFDTKTRDKKVALALIKKALKRHCQVDTITTDGLRSFGAAMDELGNRDKLAIGRWANNRVENSHLPFRRRERAMLRSRQMESRQKYASLHNHFATDCHLVNRQTYKQSRSPHWPHGSRLQADARTHLPKPCQTETSCDWSDSTRRRPTSTRCSFMLQFSALAIFSPQTSH